MKTSHYSAVSAPLLGVMLALSLPLSAGAQVGGQGQAYTASDIIERFAPVNLGCARELRALP